MTPPIAPRLRMRQWQRRRRTRSALGALLVYWYFHLRHRLLQCPSCSLRPPDWLPLAPSTSVDRENAPTHPAYHER